MVERIKNLLSLIGLEEATIQVSELPKAKHCTLLYPNYFAANDVSIKGVSDEELLQVIETIMVEHIKRCKKELRMVKSFRKTFA